MLAWLLCAQPLQASFQIHCYVSVANRVAFILTWMLWLLVFVLFNTDAYPLYRLAKAAARLQWANAIDISAGSASILSKAQQKTLCYGSAEQVQRMRSRTLAERKRVWGLKT